MKVLIIGKYPPIQGEVSSKMYWITKELSKYITIDVLTNSFEVEKQYRENISFLDYNLTHNGKIRLFSTNKFNLPSFIPSYNPIDIKLINKGINLCENNKYDLIIGDYLLPYAFVANYLSSTYKIPYVVGHAGSDMTRIINSTHYHTILSKVINESNGVITFKGGYRLFDFILANKHKLFFETKYNVPIKYFNEYSKLKFELFDYFNLKDPIYLHVGKLTKFKGIMELINAFSKVKFKYNLIFLGDGKHKDQIKEYCRQKKVKCEFIDFVPPWLMPSILSKAKYFLSVEHNFGVNIHAPTSFKEAMVMKTVCILSTQLNLPLDKCYIKVNTSDVEDYVRVLNYSNNLDKKIYNLYSTKAYNYIKQNDTFEKNIKNFLEFLKEVVDDYRKNESIKA